jgi:predicted metal-dependent HD superfamily phosphohydrolase
VTVPPPPDLSSFLSFDVPASLLARLRARYAEPHRRYHTWAHVLACLDARRRITEATSLEIDLALLFHDAVYEPLSRDNETASARLLVEEGRRAWLHEHVLQRASALVAVTRHDIATVAAPCLEASVVVDADLSILGADPGTFDAYETQIREEYACLDDATYAAGRRAVLRSFVERPTIFSTCRGRALWEQRARRNLARSLTQLAP